MASKRRGGFRPPELRGTLGTLLRTTTDVVRDALERGASAGRDALERGASAGRARLGDVRANRRRQDTLAELGELVLDLIRRGEVDLAELPEARDLIRQLDDFDAEDAEPELPRAVTRRRFDDRAVPRAPAVAATRPRRDSDEDGVVSSGARPRRDPDEDGVVSSGARPRRDPDEDGVVSSGARPRRDPEDDGIVASGAHPRRDSDDGGVSAGAGARRAIDDESSASAASRFARPTMPARPRHIEPDTTRPPTKPMKDIGRHLDEAEPNPAAKRPALTLPHDPHRKGGISFDDDDLNEYMHPDDVPPKSPPKDPSDGDA